MIDVNLYHDTPDAGEVKPPRSSRYIPTATIKLAVQGSEVAVLHAIGIDWDARRGHIDCPYADHGGKDDWRWDDKQKLAHCSCMGGRGDKRGHNIFDVVLHKERINFEAAKLRVAEIMGRADLIREKRASDGQRWQATDASSLLSAPAESRDDELPWRYLGARLGVDPNMVPRPATRAVGLKALGYYDPPASNRAKPKLVATAPCAIFETRDRDGRTHAHRIYLNADGTGKADLGARDDGAARDPKKSAKAVAGDVTSGRSVLWGDAEKAPVAMLSEGVETGFAIALTFEDKIAAGEILVAACISAGGIEAFEPWPSTRRVVVAADRDERSENGKLPSRRGERAGRTFAMRHHTAGVGDAALPVFIALPGQPSEKIDWLDVLRRDGIEAVRAGIHAAVLFKPTQAELDAGLKGQISGKALAQAAPAVEPILIASGELPKIVDQIEAALAARDPGLYQRDGVIAQMRVVTAKGADEHETSALVIRPVELHHLRDRAMSAVAFLKYNAKAEDWFPIDPGLEYFHALLGRGQWRLRPLTGIILAPTLRADGSIIDQPGYDDRTGLFFDARDEQFPSIHSTPSIDDARAARLRLEDLVASFPFVSDADRAVWLSAVLTALVRRTLPTAPMHAFSAPTAGSGKSMLVDLVSIIATGWAAPVLNPSRDEERLSSDIDSALLSGLLIASIDNIAAPLESAALCQTLSQERRAIRLFHTQRHVEASCNMFVAATGNNLRLVGDLTRRALMAMIDPQVERPETREFKTSPLSVARERRSQLVADALTILRAFIAAKRPSQRPPLGTFEAWSRLVRDALIWTGAADCAQTMENTRQADPAAEQLAAVMDQWAVVLGDGRHTAKEAIEAAQERVPPTDFNRGGAFAHSEFQSALSAVAGERGSIDGRRLGNWLSKFAGKIIGGKRLVRDGARSGVAYWCLQTVAGQPQDGGLGGLRGSAEYHSREKIEGSIGCGEASFSGGITQTDPSKPTKPTNDPVEPDAPPATEFRL